MFCPVNMCIDKSKKQNQKQIYFPSTYKDLRFAVYSTTERNLVNIEVTDIPQCKKYFKNNIKLDKITDKAIHRAFSLEDSNLSFTVHYLPSQKCQESAKQEKNADKSKQILLLKIRILPPFLLEMIQDIYLTEVLELSSLDILKEKVVGINSQLNQLKMLPKFNQKLCTVKSQVVAHRNENPMFDDYDYDEDYDQQNQLTQMVAITLPEIGKYLLTLSFMVKANNKLFFVYDDKNYSVLLSGFTNGGLYLPTFTEYSPFLRTMVLSTSQKNYRQTFYIYNTYDYPATYKNIVLSAQRVKQ